MRPFFQVLHDSVVVSGQAADRNLQQQKLNLERERLTFDERQARQQRAPDELSYREVHANEAEWRITQDEKDAFNGCRALHDDCEKLEVLMHVVAKTLRPDWTQMTMREYVECLYVVVKNADFAEQARRAILTR